jgi:hypothetical protein
MWLQPQNSRFICIGMHCFMFNLNAGFTSFYSIRWSLKDVNVEVTSDPVECGSQLRTSTFVSAINERVWKVALSTCAMLPYFSVHVTWPNSLQLTSHGPFLGFMHQSSRVRPDDPHARLPAIPSPSPSNPVYTVTICASCLYLNIYSRSQPTAFHLLNEIRVMSLKKRKELPRDSRAKFLLLRICHLP